MSRQVDSSIRSQRSETKHGFDGYLQACLTSKVEASDSKGDWGLGIIRRMERRRHLELGLAGASIPPKQGNGAQARRCVTTSVRGGKL